MGGNGLSWNAKPGMEGRLGLGVFGMGSGIFQLREQHEEWLRRMRTHDQKTQREAGRVEHGRQRPWTLSSGGWEDSSVGNVLALQA